MNITISCSTSNRQSEVGPVHLLRQTGKCGGRLVESTLFLTTVTVHASQKISPGAAEVSHLKEADAAAANDGKVCSSSLKEKRAAPAETNEVAQKPKSPWRTTPEVPRRALAAAVLFSPLISEWYPRRNFTHYTGRHNSKLYN